MRVQVVTLTHTKAAVSSIYAHTNRRFLYNFATLAVCRSFIMLDVNTRTAVSALQQQDWQRNKLRFDCCDACWRIQAHSRIYMYVYATALPPNKKSSRANWLQNHINQCNYADWQTDKQQLSACLNRYFSLASLFFSHCDHFDQAAAAVTAVSSQFNW